MAPANGTNMICRWVEMPGPYVVNQTFGPSGVTGEPICNGSQTHRGIDIGVDAGNWTIIPHELTGSFKVNVIGTNASRGYGNLVIVRDVLDSAGNKWDVYLAHHSSVSVPDGALVAPGQRLAITDSTGFSSGPHLHFEVRPAGDDNTCNAVDPTWMMQDPTGSGTGTASNISLLNGGLDLNPLAGVAGAITQAEQSFATMLTNYITALAGAGMMGAGALTAGLTLAKMTPAQAIQAAASRMPAGKPEPAAAPVQKPQRIYTPTERQWRPQRMTPVTAEGARAKLAAGQRLSVAEARALGAVPRA